MSRELLFRAYINGKMISEDDLAFESYEILKDLMNSGELIQYTGLKDMDGVKIFEGDIYHQGDENIRYQVVFKDCGFVGQQIGNKSTVGLVCFQADIKKIGNIHQNKELLK